MSAQLHRERKRAYIDKLEGEVRDRDAIIATLQSENARLRRLLSASGVDERSSSPVDVSSDLGATTNSDANSVSDFSEDGTTTPPPPRKRSSSPTPSAAKSARLTGTGFLAAFACLMVFRSPSMPGALQRFVLPAPSAPAPRLESVRAGGRVLMNSFDSEEDSVAAEIPLTHGGGKDEENSRSLSLSVVSPKSSLTVDGKSKSLETNSSYLFCPTLIQTASEWHEQPPLNGSEFEESRRRETSKPRRQQLRHRHRRMTEDTEKTPSKSTAVVASSLSSPATHSATSIAISKFLLERPHPKQNQDENATDSSASDGSLVLRGPSNYHGAAGGTQQHAGTSDSGDVDGAFGHLMLVVPSSSLDGFSGSFDNRAATSWVEIGCRMDSARFVDFSQ